MQKDIMFIKEIQETLKKTIQARFVQNIKIKN